MRRPATSRRSSSPRCHPFAATFAFVALAAGGGCTDAGSNRSAARGYIAADRAQSVSVRSVARPPPPLDTLDPSSVLPSQPENAVPVDPAGGPDSNPSAR